MTATAAAAAARPNTLAAAKADGHSTSARARQLTGAASPKSLRRAYSMNSTGSNSTSNSSAFSESVTAKPQAAVALLPLSPSFRFSSSGSARIAPLFIPEESSTGSSSVADAAGDIETGTSSGAADGLIVSSSNSDGVQRLRHSFSDIPLNIAKLLPYSGSDDWGLRTLREESSSAAASATTSVQ
jgi:hypothetical protein